MLHPTRNPGGIHLQSCILLRRSGLLVKSVAEHVHLVAFHVMMANNKHDITKQMWGEPEFMKIVKIVKVL